MPADTSDLRKLAADLRAAGPKVHSLGHAAVAKTARDIERDARALAPVDSGELRDSITVRSGGLTASVAATAAHAQFVEYGTSRMGPQPFLRPATDKHEETFHAAAGRIGGMIL